MKKMTFATALTLSAPVLFFALTSCGPSGNSPNVELIQDMMHSPAIKAQEFDESSPDNRGMRTPPEHTVPVGFEEYRHKGDAEGAKGMKNPLAGQMNPETLLAGQKFYETNCMVCHGQKGEGGEAARSVVSAKMALKPPAVTSEKVAAMTDGQVYHIITEGQGIMGPYASHIPQKYRWQVVNYVRFLQKQNSQK